MARRRLPPLNPLRMFEAAARHESFTRAAEELGVTQAAVSRQVAVLEGALDTRLFERRRTAVRLTDRGRRYLDSIRPAFDLIDDATAEMTGSAQKSVLRLRAYTTLAAHWLIPRLPDFAERSPGVTVQLSTAVAPADFERADVDANIRFGDGRWPGLTARRFLDDALAPVCSPSLRDGPGPLAAPEDLHRQVLLHSRYRRRDWPDWAAHVGLEGLADGGPVFDSSTLTYQAAAQGIGVAMGQISLLDRDLTDGRLVMPFETVLRRPLGYYLVYPKRRRRGGPIAAFEDWILAAGEAARSSAAAPT